MFNSNTFSAYALSKIEKDTPISTIEALSASLMGQNKAAKRTGRWTLDEKILFLYGLRKFGKGRWKKMSDYLPDRSLVQIKSHAQKVLKRLKEGEHVFRRLEENGGRLQMLLAGFNEVLDPKIIQAGVFDTNPEPSPTTTRRKRRKTTETVPEGPEHIIAASALCQLAAPTRPPTKSEVYDPTSVTLPSALAASFFAAGTSHPLQPLGALPTPQLWTAHYGDLPM